MKGRTVVYKETGEKTPRLAFCVFRRRGNSWLEGLAKTVSWALHVGQRKKFLQKIVARFFACVNYETWLCANEHLQLRFFLILVTFLGIFHNV